MRGLDRPAGPQATAEHLPDAWISSKSAVGTLPGTTLPCFSCAAVYCSALYEEHDMETNRNLLQLLDPTGNSRVYRSRRELARDEQTYYERFYSADTNDTAVKNTVASIA